MGQSGADTSFAAMQQRGKNVMGVDQYASQHTFDDLSDGGRITLVMPDAGASDVSAIRTHLKTIAKEFAAGNFASPSQVHAMAVPGTDVMAQKAAVIRYRYEDMPKGGAVRITTSDATALAAIHSFLSFQRSAHHAEGMHDMTHD
jgi:hypothetical protein